MRINKHFKRGIIILRDKTHVEYFMEEVKLRPELNFKVIEESKIHNTIEYKGWKLDVFSLNSGLRGFKYPLVLCENYLYMNNSEDVYPICTGIYSIYRDILGTYNFTSFENIWGLKLELDRFIKTTKRTERYYYRLYLMYDGENNLKSKLYYILWVIKSFRISYILWKLKSFKINYKNRKD